MRGEVWLVRLDPTVGSEMKKTRPCLVVSPNEMLRMRTVIVAPITSRGFAARFRTTTHFGGIPGYILLDQIRVVDKVRFVRNLGTLPTQELRDVLATLSEMFAE